MTESFQEALTGFSCAVTSSMFSVGLLVLVKGSTTLFRLEILVLVDVFKTASSVALFALSKVSAIFATSGLGLGVLGEV